MILRNNVTGEYAGPFEGQDDERALALTALREPGEPTRPLWAETASESLENAKAAGVHPSLVGVIPQVAAGDDYTVDLGTVEEAATVVGVAYYPNSDITGVATNSRSIVVNDGETAVATIAFTAGTNGNEGQPTEAASIASASVAQGDDLTAVSTHVGTGLVDPGGVVVVTFEGNESLTGRDFSEDATDE